jgi:protein-disulfide isomerase
MPSGKQSKRARRQQRQVPPPVRGKGIAGRRASPKVVLAGAGVVAAIVVAAVLVLVLTNGSSSGQSVPTRGTLVNALPGAGEVNTEFRGIAQSGNVLGSPKAPVTIVQYIDLQCPYCRELETQAMPEIVSRYVRTGKAKLVARVVAFIGPDSQRGRLAAIAAGEQGKMFNFMQLAYANQGVENSGWLDDDFVQSAAASIPGMDVPRLVADSGTSRVERHAASFDTAAKADRVAATPALFVGRSGQRPTAVPLRSPTDVASIAAAIKAAGS